LQFLRKRSWM